MLLKYDIIGKEFLDKAGNKFIVKSEAGRNERSIMYYNIEYESGWKTTASSGHIRAGEVKDMLSPSVFGWGCLGTAEGYAKRKESRRLYYTWRNMIRRCYDSNYKAYRWYGAIGIQVCERWRRLDNFLEDIVKLPGFDAEKFEAGELELDKDIRGRGKKIYSPETCMLVSAYENKVEENKAKTHKQ